MVLMQRSCPRCHRVLRFPLWDQTFECPGCARSLSLAPAFLATLSEKILFFLGALLLGTTVADIYASIGLVAQGLPRLLADLVVGVGYFGVCRLLFSAFQRIEICPSNGTRR